MPRSERVLERGDWIADGEAVRALSAGARRSEDGSCILDCKHALLGCKAFPDRIVQSLVSCGVTNKVTSKVAD
jgi:hypothetical protein